MRYEVRLLLVGCCGRKKGEMRLSTTEQLSASTSSPSLAFDWLCGDVVQEVDECEWSGEVAVVQAEC